MVQEGMVGRPLPNRGRLGPMGHTPGPWKFDKWNDEKLEALILMDCDHPDGWRFGAWMDTRNEANARLIAAAPEMLEALKMVLEVGLAEEDGAGTVESVVYKAIAAAKQGE